jgi:hypothetical protein
MPVLRYFVYVGGALLALLFVCDAVIPQVPLPATLNSGSDLPAVRIRSERKWPERVVIDTTVAPVKTAAADAPKADAGQQAAAAGDTQKAKMRDAYAQVRTAATKTASSARTATFKVADAAPAKAAESKPEFNKPEAKPRRKVAKVHPPRSMMLVAQQPPPHFGFFDFTW